MIRKVFSAAVILSLMISCSGDDDQNNSNTIITPASYTFERNGASTVNFEGQTIRIAMADEFTSALLDPARTETSLDAMFSHAPGGEDFSDAVLNASDKNLRSKIAASADYFSTNTTFSNIIRSEFDAWIAAQVSEVFPNWEQSAVAGQAGVIQQLGGGALRHVNAKGMEYNQIIAKGLIGGLMLDQILNNYTSTALLDAGSNVTDNNNGVTAAGKPYTTMEHYWDEAYGYVYGAEADPANPVLDADKFMSEYLFTLEEDPDFKGIASEVFDAFALGRAAIVEKDYTLRDAQVEILQEKLSLIPAVRGVYYLQSGKAKMQANDMASAFHAWSEAYGFIYSLQFTRVPGTSSPYFTYQEVKSLLNQLEAGNGFWELNATTLDAISETIADRFGFTVAEASSL